MHGALVKSVVVLGYRFRPAEQGANRILLCMQALHEPSSAVSAYPFQLPLASSQLEGMHLTDLSVGFCRPRDEGRELFPGVNSSLRIPSDELSDVISRKTTLGLLSGP